MTVTPGRRGAGEPLTVTRTLRLTAARAMARATATVLSPDPAYWQSSPRTVTQASHRHTGMTMQVGAAAGRTHSVTVPITVCRRSRGPARSRSRLAAAAAAAASPVRPGANTLIEPARL